MVLLNTRDWEANIKDAVCLILLYMSECLQSKLSFSGVNAP